MRVSPAKSGEDDFAADRFPVFLPEEQQVRRVEHPKAAMAPRDTGGNIQIANESGDSIGASIAFGIFQDLHSVATGPGGLARILDAFGDPNASTIIEGHGDRIDDLGFAGD